MGDGNWQGGKRNRDRERANRMYRKQRYLYLPFHIRLNATDILKRFGRGAETGKGKLTRKVSDSAAAAPPPNLPYLQTLV